MVSTTGIAGLTLGGGVRAGSWPSTGSPMDNLLSAEVITASGDVLRASEGRKRAICSGRLRGGRRQLRRRVVVRVPPASGGPGHERARRLLLRWRSRRAETFSGRLRPAPPDDSHGLWRASLHAPGRCFRSRVLIVCHCGTLGPRPRLRCNRSKVRHRRIMDTIGPATYEATNMMLDAGFRAVRSTTGNRAS